MIVGSVGFSVNSSKCRSVSVGFCFGLKDKIDRRHDIQSVVAETHELKVFPFFFPAKGKEKRGKNQLRPE